MKNAERNILWVSPLIFDVSLHRTAQLELIRSLANKGYHVFLLGMKSKAVFKLEEKTSKSSFAYTKILQVPIRYSPIIAPVIYSFVTIFLVPIIILRFNPDFVIVEKGMLSISVLPSIIISKFKKTKFILDIRSIPVEVQGFYGALHKFFFFISVLIAKKIFSGITIVTPMEKKRLCSNFSIDPNRVGVWENGVNIALFNPEDWRTQGNELKAKLGLSGKFVVFYHGYLVSTRGINQVIEAMKIVAKRRSDVVFFILGSGPLAKHLKLLIKKENIQNIVFVHDPVDYKDVPRFISMCDVGISPTPNYPYWWFQSPLNVLEYLSMEKPVLATDLPLHRRIMSNQKCAIYIASANPEAIAKAIEFAAKNKEKLNDWGKVGRNIILQNYTWEKIAENFHNYLYQLHNT
ncbi:TPA: glycosyltransferase [Candidatus Poribacteria bacterium]|nr:glycosyltransferase [Candidatus Poribacteria bacterium]